MLKLHTYTGVIREAAEVLSRFKNIGLSSLDLFENPVGSLPACGWFASPALHFVVFSIRTRRRLYSLSGPIEAAVSLARALKQVIETNICTGNGMINAQSGIVFHKIRKEYGGNVYV